MLKNHIKIALRNLFGSRLFTSLNIIGLSGGMVAAVFILLWVKNESSFDTFHKKSEQIKRILTHYQVSKQEIWHWSSTPLLLANEIKLLPEITKATRKIASSNLPIKVADKMILADHVAYVDSNWFEVFDYNFLDGSINDFKSGIRNIAMTESRAEQLFGKTDVAGKIVRIDSLDYKISAVFANNPANSSFQYDYILPLSAYLSNPGNLKNDNNWGNFNYETFIVVRPDADLKKLDKKLTAIISNAKKDDKGNPSKDIVLESEALADLHFNNAVQGAGQNTGDHKTVYIFFGLAMLILFVACINYVNLTTARASMRAKEVGMKKLLGATHSHLFGQFMTESILTCLLSLGLALILIFALMPSFNDLTGKIFVLSLTNSSLWYVLFGTTFFAILLTGIYPSLLLSSFKPFETLRGNNVFGSNNGNFRKGLVIVQFTVSVVFLISTLVVFQQMKFIRDKKLGYDRGRTFTFMLPWNMVPKVEAKMMKAQLLNQPGIEDVTISSANIVDISSSHSGSLDWDGRPADFQPTVGQINVESNFQSMFGLKMSDGRWFAENSIADKNNVILNEAAVRKLNIPKPVIGQRFHFQGKKGTVIGVVKDFHYKSLREKIEPLVLFTDSEWSRGIYVKYTKGNAALAIKSVEKIRAEMVPNYPLDYKFLDETFDRLYKNEQRSATLFNTFTIIAVLISCLGLFGLATFTAERRIKEIGIRKVLGASISGIVKLLSTDFVILVLISVLIASPIAYYVMNKWLEGFAYRIEIHWWIFPMIGLLTVLIAVFTISFQSIKAAMMNPVKSE
ncbi:ABC transporter permease [Dyadobacter frigoris]|uniref:FtsX-like permease family protein n=1 Tax=Dyadobacter frigoris TaxID=2576211 RepID=A0A4U6D6G7_9BACT|nr:ABC transporter permease [Dyadobacter frigoris]TKT91708.1 FtsX-like permease family protein [Dyadobacter frigoris]